MKILLISGSDRKGSLNTQLADYALEFLKEKAEASLLNYSDVPMFSQDLEFPVPDPVEKVRQQVKEADALWFFSPEYNGNMTPMLMNLVDWLSRPAYPGQSFKEGVLRGRLYTISGIGGKNGTKSSQKSLETMLNFLGMKGYTEKDAMLAMTPAVMKSGNLDELPEAKEAIDAQAAGLLETLA